MHFFSKLRLALHVLKGAFIAGVIFLWCTPEQRHEHIRRWSLQLLRICGVTAQIENAKGELWINPPDYQALAGAMILSNHISFLDIYAINSWLPARFVAKSEIRNWPVFGWFAQQSGTIFIERSKRSDAKRIMHYLAERLQSGDAICVFPEGTTGDGTTLLPFHANLLQAPIAIQANLLPIAIRYEEIASGKQSLAPAYVGDLTLSQCISAVLSSPPLKVIIRIGDVIPTEGMHRRDASALVASQIEKMMKISNR